MRIDDILGTEGERSPRIRSEIVVVPEIDRTKINTKTSDKHMDRKTMIAKTY